MITITNKNGEEKSFNLGSDVKEKNLHDDINLYMKASQTSDKWNDKVLTFRGHYGDGSQLVDMTVKPAELSGLVYKCDKIYYADEAVHA